MKIKKTRLLQIIQEELSRINEAPAFRDDPEGEAAADKMMARRDQGEMLTAYGADLDKEEREQYKNDLNNEELSIAERKKAYDALIADLLNNFYKDYNKFFKNKKDEDSTQEAGAKFLIYLQGGDEGDYKNELKIFKSIKDPKNFLSTIERNSLVSAIRKKSKFASFAASSRAE